MTTSLRSAFAHSPSFGLKTLARKLGFAFAVFMIVSPAILVFLWMLSLSLKTELDNTSYPPVFWPSEPAWRALPTARAMNEPWADSDGPTKRPS